MSKAQAFDFDALDLARETNNPVEIEIVHPATEKGLGVFVSVVGAESEKFQTYMRAEVNKARQDATEKGLGVFVSVVGAESEKFQTYMRAEVNKARQDAYLKRNRKADAPVPFEEEEATITRAIAACITAWRTVVDGKSEPAIFNKGERIEFSEAAALKWLTQYPWVRKQINDATADLLNFIKA